VGFCHGTPFHIPCLRYLPRTMHAAYLAKEAGVVGGMNWQLPAHE
jgi:hypothetical protein